MAVIDLATPVRQEKDRDANGRRRVVFVYTCPTCRGTVRVFANSFRGPTAVPGVGGIVCPQCPKEEHGNPDRE